MTMKSLTASIVIMLLVSFSVSAQSKSYQTLKEKFSDSKIVSVHTSGFLARTILRMAGEHEFNYALWDVSSIRVIVIPKHAFKAHQVTLKGFCKFAREDSFEELAFIRDGGEDVTVLMQQGKKKDDNTYLVLVDSDDEVVAVEVEGYIDPALLYDKKMAYQY
jgi:hypothetical protein